MLRFRDTPSSTHFLENIRTPCWTVFSQIARGLFPLRVARTHVGMLKLLFQPRDQRVKTRWVLVQTPHLECTLKH
jgi:hypothetical protein